MVLEIAGQHVETNDQGYLCNLNEWSENYTKTVAAQDGVQLFNDHWELILYFREYYEENQTVPTMHKVVRELGKIRVFIIRRLMKNIFTVFSPETLFMKLVN